MGVRPGLDGLNGVLQAEGLLDTLDCGLEIAGDERRMADRFPGPETPDDRLVLRCQLCFGLDTRTLRLPYLTAIPDEFVPARFQSPVDRLTLDLTGRSQDCCHNGEIGVLLPFGVEDGELFFLEEAVDVVVFQELDSFQDLIAFTAKSGEFRDQDDVDRVVQAEGERFLENRSILVGLPAGDVLLEDLDYGETVGGSVTLKVFHLAGGVLTGLKGSGR